MVPEGGHEAALSPLTRGKFWKKESPRLRRQNRRMVAPMGTTLHTFCGRVQLTLAAGLLVACMANVALVWAFL